MSGETILVVDDHETNRKLIEHVLSIHNYRVIMAEHAEEALELINEHRPHLILMDIQLPGMDGLTLTRQLRQDPSLQGLIIIALSAYAMKGDREKALASGCDDYVTKPISTRALPKLIAQHLAAR